MENNVKIEVIDNKNRWSKNFGYLAFYWLSCLLVPLLMMFVVADLKKGAELFTTLIFPSVLIPFFFVFIPYRFAKLNNWKEKIVFVLTSLTVPIIFLYFAVEVVSVMMTGYVIFAIIISLIINIMANNIETEGMINKKRWLENVGFLALYWLFCLLSPFLLIFVIGDFTGSNEVLAQIFPPSIFIPPFLVFIPFLFAKLNNWREKIIFILVSLTLPLVYLYLIIKVLSSIKFGGIIFL